MPSQFPYDPTARDTCERIDWFRVHPASWQAPVRKWRRVSLQDIVEFVADERYARLYEGVPMELKVEFKRRAESREEAEKQAPKIRSSKDDILLRVDEVVGDAEVEGDLTAKLRALELMAKVEQLLSVRERPDPVITINVITGVPRG